jgi:hypothetical protein
MILLVVLALLTLFAIIGISFVLYSNSEAASSRLACETVTTSQADMEPEMLLALFLNQWVFDADDVNGVYSALRGHSLARTMFGLNGTITGNPPRLLPITSGSPFGNTTPFNGTGRRHFQNPALQQDEFFLVNYTYFASLGDPLRDPERIGAARSSPSSPYAPDSYVGFNAPYTYADLNNMYLAAVRADGTVLVPSFHRPWLFNDPGKTFNDPSNSNWTSPQGKYLTLRPRPREMGPGFPYPEDPGGDVKNLIGSPGFLVNTQYANNDSIWIDLGAPVITAPDGTKFKPLFAPLVVDLDNRVNLNVHGNTRGRDPFNNGVINNASNEGWGPWEVGLGWVLNKQGAGGVNEWPNIFLGSGGAQQPGANAPGSPSGRYGADGKPNAGNASNMPPAGPWAHFYNQYDYDGCNELGNFYPTAPVTLAAPFSFSSFPTFPAGYSNGSPYNLSPGPPWERTDHPSDFSFFQPQGDDHVFVVSNMEALLRYGDTGSPALTSDLFRLCPVSFADGRIRNLVTTHSFDLDRPGVAPWIWDPATQPYTLDPTQVNSPFPWGSALGFPGAGATPPANSEFGPDRRALSAGLGALLGRVDVNRPLTDYPAPDASGTITDLATYNQAVYDRQQLASDIYERLRAVTGAADPSSVPVNSPQYNAVRALAQLAVNIVDFIDTDDYMTPFNWYGSEYVFGTELPRAVINEAYVEFANDPADPGLNLASPRATTVYKVRFWVELHNPLAPGTFPDANLSDGGAARLQNPGFPTSIYQLVIANADWDKSNYLRQPGNVLGDPEQYAAPLLPPATYPPPPTRNPIRIVSSFVPDPTAAPPAIADYNLIKPANGNYRGANGKNEGFYVLGPHDDFPVDPLNPGNNPAAPPQATLRVRDQVVNGYQSSMTYDWPVATPLLLGAPLPKHTLLLRRLACPFLPPNPPYLGAPLNPGPFNPYITVDYLEDVPSNDGIKYDATGSQRGGLLYPISSRASYGRNQPYAAHVSQQNSQESTVTNQPQHTFFRHNAAEQNGIPIGPPNPTLLSPFNWLVHLDRQVISPMELLQVSGFKPHELTQQFMVAGQPPYGQRAPWLDEDLAQQQGAYASRSHRLYRAFEFLQTGSRANGVVAGGRIPGKINLNTIWDPETLLALCDPQSNGLFGKGDIYNPDDPYSLSTLFGQLIRHRTPNVASGGSPGPGDQPFLSLATGDTAPGDTQYPGGIDLTDTILAPAIVTTGIQSVAAGPQQTVTPGAMSGTVNGTRWQIGMGTVLIVDSGPNREVVQVNGVTPQSFQANLAKAHAAGFAISLAGSSPRLFQVTGAHPYLQNQLLTKVFNQVTTRSNVFALWLTVGFFEVTNDQTRPVQLGREVGRAENRHIRHRMFAIVDRSNLTVNPFDSASPGAPPIYVTGQNGVTTPGAATAVAVASLSGTYEDLPWLIQPGASLLVDTGPNQEMVQVSAVSAGPVPSFTALYQKAHAAGFPIVVGLAAGGKAGLPGIPGNPGPQLRFDPRANPALVRYFSIID